MRLRNTVGQTLRPQSGPYQNYVHLEFAPKFLNGKSFNRSKNSKICVKNIIVKLNQNTFKKNNSNILIINAYMNQKQPIFKIKFYKKFHPFFSVKQFNFC